MVAWLLLAGNAAVNAVATSSEDKPPTQSFQKTCVEPSVAGRASEPRGRTALLVCICTWEFRIQEHRIYRCVEMIR